MSMPTAWYSCLTKTTALCSRMLSGISFILSLMAVIIWLRCSSVIMASTSKTSLPAIWGGRLESIWLAMAPISSLSPEKPMTTSMGLLSRRLSASMVSSSLAVRSYSGSLASCGYF